jgi:EAL domain-containing protein (putative c-di-GMP-specific phosphodiesterase class I)
MNSTDDPVEVARDKRIRTNKIDKAIEKARAAREPQSKIRELLNQKQEILLEGRIMTDIDKAKRRTDRLLVLEIREAELQAELKQVQKQIKELKNEGRPKK